MMIMIFILIYIKNKNNNKKDMIKNIMNDNSLLTVREMIQTLCYCSV